MERISRRLFIGRAAWAGAATTVMAPLLARAADRPPPLDSAQVHAFVRAAHKDLEQVEAMLAEEPALVNAAWDWGGGDWETGLGGAAHMGVKEIARYLLAHGAREDIFCAAMLGKVAVVEAFVRADPHIVQLKGPHGIPLMRHALAGEQEEIVELLKAHGA